MGVVAASSAVGAAPGSGTLTLLATDFEGSERHWARARDAMALAVAALREVLSSVVTRHGGQLLMAEPESDVLVASFPRPSQALAAAVEIRRAAHAKDRMEELGHDVRVALDTCTPARNVPDRWSIGPPARRCARLCATARGGQIVLSRATRELVDERLPAGAELLDLGVHRLPDLGRPERVFELIARDLPVDRRSLNSLDALPNNLPRELTSLVGRSREVAEVRELLERARLLTLVGAGGCGKSRLALQSGADALARFRDGVWFVELAPIENDQLIGHALATAVGVRPRAGQSELGAAISFLASRHALIILDNCEHLLTAAGDVARSLLEQCPEAVVLATSRAPLALPGEITWLVPSLSLPDPSVDERTDALARSDAAWLFVDRARSVSPDFRVTPASAAALTRLCAKLDGIPLALELAAARVRIMSVEQIEARLADRFGLLARDARAVCSRHATLRASVDWSHELLSDRERRLLRRLAVFRGSFGFDAVEKVAAFNGGERPETLDILASLVDQSLVVAEQRGTAMRYRLLETVREYALGKLSDADELDDVRSRHRDFFLELAERAEPELVSASCPRWLGLLDADTDNLSAALEWAHASDPVRALRLCAALAIWWRLRGMFAQADTGCARALRGATSAPPGQRARVLWAMAYLLLFAGRHEEAFQIAHEAAQMAEKSGDRSTMARALWIQGTLRSTVDPVRARPVLARARELAGASADEWCFAGATISAAWSHVITDDYAEAERLFGDCLPIVERSGYDEFLAWTLLGLSFRHHIEANFERFFELAERAVQSARALGEPVSENLAHALMARVEVAQGRPEQALKRIETSRERAIAAGAGYALHQTDTALATVRAALGDLDAARDALERVVSSGADSGWYLSSPLVELAEVLQLAGEAARAERNALRVVEITERIDNQMRRAWAKEILGRLAVDRGEWRTAEALLHEALATEARHKIYLRITQTLDGLAAVAVGCGNHEKAARLLGAAARARSDLGIVSWATQQRVVDGLKRELRATLGEEAFTTAWREGASLRLDDAVAWAQRGRGSRKRPPDGWDSLTPTEKTAAHHAAAGLTNPEIAAAMFITRGTVKAHLHRIYSKIGVRNRTELTAVVAERSSGRRDFIAHQ